MHRRLLENSLLFVLVVIVAVRPLINETYDSGMSSIDRVVGAVGEYSLFRTLLIDCVILLAALVSTIARWRERSNLKGCRIAVLGFGLIAFAGVVSCVLAGNKRIAINATFDWLSLPILAVTLVSLMRAPWQRRLLLAAIMGSAAIQTWQCFEQYAWGFDDTIAHYEQNMEAFWRNQGIEPDAPRVDMFEGRMYAREVSGTMPHSSITASYLLLVVFAALGLSVAFIRTWHICMGTGHRLALLLSILLTISAGAMLYQTGSRGAMLSGAGAIVLWMALVAARRYVLANVRRLFIGAWIGFAILVAATIGHGLYQKSLPGVSLTFRWQYWTASAEMVADHPWTGVGRENFGRHYLQYKSIKSPEEVSNPHNLFVQAACDWGVVGLVGLILMLLGTSRVIVLGGREGEFSIFDASRNALGNPPPQSPLGKGGGGSETLLFLALTVAVLALRVPLLGTGDVNYLYYETVTGALAWLMGAGLVWFGLRAANGSDESCPAERTVATAVGFGLLAFMIHDLINFALFVPATATTFFALAAYVVRTRCACAAVSNGGSKRATRILNGGPHAEREYRSSHRVIAGMFLSSALGCFVWFGLIPVARSGSQLARARAAVQAPLSMGDVNQDPAAIAYELSAERDRLDPTPLVEQGQWLAAVAQVDPAYKMSAVDRAADSLRRAAMRDPYNAGLFRTLGRVYLMRAGETKARADFEQAIEAAVKALELYPQDPPSLVTLADTYAEAGRTLNDPLLLQEAIDNYKAALDLDDQRIEWERLRRFRPSEREEIQRKIEAIRNSGN